MDLRLQIEGINTMIEVAVPLEDRGKLLSAYRLSAEGEEIKKLEQEYKSSSTSLNEHLETMKGDADQGIKGIDDKLRSLLKNQSSENPKKLIKSSEKLLKEWEDQPEKIRRFNDLQNLLDKRNSHQTLKDNLEALKTKLV